MSDGVATRTLSIGCRFTHSSQFAIPAIFQVEPLADQKVEVSDARWSFEPDIPITRYTDLYGNPCRRLIVTAGQSVFGTTRLVVVPDATEDVDEDRAGDRPRTTCRTTCCSTPCPAGTACRTCSGNEAWSRFGATAPGYRRVQAICDHVHDHLTFSYGSSGPDRPPLTSTPVGLRGLPRLHPPRHLVLPGAEHPRPLRLRLPAGDRRPGRPAPMDFAAWMEV